MAQGKKEAISVLYDRYARLVFSLALAILRDRQLAEEVTQDTFFNAWRGAAGFRAEQGRVSTWLSAIARHRAIDELRRRRLPVLNMEEPWWETLASNPSSASGEEGILLMQMSKALSDLPREQREAISLAYFGGLTQEEIAERLGEPLGTVKTRIRLGLKKLREAIQKE
ncbi:MAG: sigma-70 family RNA polymerase sigma factor [Chloroflexi bacterium]|nr:sigma-70 family RNA polymerase sigma factor [Chloroflexota bacterium]